MNRTIASLALLVADYDDAISFYVEKLGFLLIEDTPLGADKRWVRVGPVTGGTALLLARAEGPQQATHIGDQTGGRVFLFLETDDFARDHALFLSRGVRFLEEPRFEAYGAVVVFEDLYGNRWDLIEPKRAG
jgi:catechol 2,3-dioxygenase-like lactoylglutathione lyase family enzyme